MTDILEGKRVPRIYAYTENQYENHDWSGKTGRIGKGWIKVGYTERTAKERIEEQRVKQPTKTPYSILLDEVAIRKDGTYFKDYDVHKVLSKTAYKYPDSEWFECTLEEVEQAIFAVKNHKRTGQLSYERNNKRYLSAQGSKLYAVKVDIESFFPNIYTHYLINIIFFCIMNNYFIFSYH